MRKISRKELRKGDLDLSGIDFLRNMVQAISYCNEDFLCRYTVEQLLAIWEACLASEFDMYPDQWTPAQVRAALRGWVPAWDEDGKPIMSTVRIVKNA